MQIWKTRSTKAEAFDQQRRGYICKIPYLTCSHEGNVEDSDVSWRSVRSGVFRFSIRNKFEEDLQAQRREERKEDGPEGPELHVTVSIARCGHGPFSLTACKRYKRLKCHSSLSASFVSFFGALVVCLKDACPLPISRPGEELPYASLQLARLTAGVSSSRIAGVSFSWKGL